MNGELALYTSQIKRSLERLCSTIEGLGETQLNWTPPAPDTNSIYVIATHLLGNAEAWVLGIACGQPIDRDRPAEFRAAGPDAAPLIARARDLVRRIEEALTGLAPESLDGLREPRQRLWGAGTAAPVTGREAIMHAIEHASIHLGQIDVTRDLALAATRA